LNLRVEFATYDSLIHHQFMKYETERWMGRVFLGLTLSLILFAPVYGQMLVPSDLIGQVRAKVAHNSFAGAEADLQSYKSQRGVTPEYLEALSWMARGAAEAGQWDKAASYATETRRLCEQQLGGTAAANKQKLESEPHSAIAMGAAYEVLAQGLAEKGQHAQAVSLLRSALARYRNTTIGARLQKNLNLLALVASLKGSPVLLFFWAHWCVDCKAEVPVIARLKQEFAPEGLIVMGPTQLYGYAAQGNDASPEQEKAYIEAVRERYYSSLLDMPVPLSKQNFNAYGASTTPTLVVLNRAGQVAMYHPGAVSYEELRAAVQKVIAR
jgi:thiol-disulfide isomerase/thioredoxin